MISPRVLLVSKIFSRLLLNRSGWVILVAPFCGCAESPSPNRPSRPTEPPSIEIGSVQFNGKSAGGLSSGKDQGPKLAPGTNATKKSDEPIFDTTRMTLKVVSPDPNVASRAYNVGDRIFFAFELTSDLPDEKHATVGYNLMLNRVTYDSQWLKKMDLPLPKGTSRYEGERIVKSNWKPGKYQLEPMAFATEFFPPEPGQTLPRSVNYKPLVKPVEIVINDPKKKPSR